MAVDSTTLRSIIISENASLDYNAQYEVLSFKIWADPASLAVTEGIIVIFFSSAYWYA